jgi:hypothetical protein
MASKPNYSDEGRIKLTLQFMIEFNRRLLSAIEAPYLIRLNSKNRELLQEGGVSKLLLANSEPDCENWLDYSSNMLDFYQEVSQSIENDPLKEYHEDLRSSLLFYKRAFIFSVSLLAFFLLLDKLKEESKAPPFSIIIMTTPFVSVFLPWL